MQDDTDKQAGTQAGGPAAAAGPDAGIANDTATGPAAGVAGDPAASTANSTETPPERPVPITAEQQMIQELEAERDQMKDQLLRSLAELENVRKRAERDRVDAKKFAVSAFARDLLTVADNLQRALDSAPEIADDDPLSGFLDGVAMTERELLSAFQRHGMTRIEALGERFDHNRHQAMFEVEQSGQPAGTVVQELQPGYLLNDRLLRPAMVGVAKESGAATPDAVNEIA